MILKLKRTPGIYLAGFMASGKSTIGRLLADHLGWRFVDLDEEIETQHHASISEIFDQRGEPEFRRLETEALRTHARSIGHGRPTVVALGGGALITPGNLELVEHSGVSIWIDCPLETVRRRVAQASHRPLARDLEKLDALYHERQPSYARADYRIAVESDDPAVTVETILKLPPFE